MVEMFDFVYVVQENLDLRDTRQIAFLLYVHVTKHFRKLVFGSERIFEAPVAGRDSESGV